MRVIEFSFLHFDSLYKSDGSEVFIACGARVFGWKPATLFLVVFGRETEEKDSYSTVILFSLSSNVTFAR